MKISVVIPCYNAEEYIWSCLESVQQQTYDQLEVIVVNDGSTDETGKLLKEWDRTESLPINFFNVENRGAAKARNLGLEKSDGEYIQFLDVDDLLEPEKIAHQVSLIKKEKNKPDFIAGAFVKQIVGHSSTEKYLDKRGHWFGLLTSNLGRTSSNLFRRFSVVNVNGFDPTLKSSQEYDLMFRLMQKENCKISLDNKILTIKRDINPDAISARNVEGNIMRYIQLRESIIEYLSSKDILSIELLDAWHQTLFIVIKRLYDYNKSKSISLYNSLLPDNFTPDISGAISRIYRISFLIFGFRITQILYKIKSGRYEQEGYNSLLKLFLN